jgi:hypothetical protein
MLPILALLAAPALVAGANADASPKYLITL